MEKPRIIQVSKIPKNVHCDFIELFFENTKKYGGGTVSRVEYDEKLATATVEFESAKAVDRVLELENIKMMGHDICVEVYKEKPQCTIEVHGPVSLVRRQNAELLQLYFESPRSNGWKVKEVTFDAKRSVAFVTFESEKMSRRVVEHSTHVLKGQTLDVKLQNNPNFGPKDSHIEGTACTVRAKGLKEIPSKDFVELYFENKRRSGGGKIKTFVLQGTDEDVADITFENEIDAKAVVEKSHTINGISVEVSIPHEVQERPMYQDRFLVEGLQDKTSDDCLVFFFETKTGLKTRSLAYHRDKNGVVLVTMESALDVAQLIADCKNETVDCAKLRLSEVYVSNYIYVSNLPPDITTDTIEIYFENTKRSKGGLVEKVELLDDTSCLVYFEDYRVITDVRRDSQILSNNALVIGVYLDCLKLTEEDALNNSTPQPVTITNLDCRKIKFINKAEEFRHDVEHILLANHAKLIGLKKGSKIMEGH
ncbi:protein mono-ADP-ribosyltransferase PARP14-like [Mercenaria mercenaria]|uniref:protein mono-ADP-ribosyltransferase PARP14-like n=1 Tax=Mercenaria mercenaria TaxID=6596 RepID=UPI00234EEDEA|nr:protein mono-ADP-ribosyltransferase PARP14-like [Mercenaria mercenaria]